MAHTRLAQIKKLKNTFDDLLAPNPNKQPDKTLQDLMGDFLSFAEAYVQEFDPSNPEGLQAQALGTTKQKEYLRSATNRIYKEWANISRACEQRQVQGDGVGLVDLSKNLEEATQHAKAYYSRFWGYKTKSDVPVVYFEKNYHITRFPFTPYALISIPFQDFDNKNWVVLAHELGHHIYWNSTQWDQYRDLHDKLRMNLLKALHPGPDTASELNYFRMFYKKSLRDELWLTWLEETFADICGTLMAGVNYVKSSIKISRDEITSGLPLVIDEDEEHPSLFVRPMIGVATLRWLAENWRSGDPDQTTSGRAALTRFANAAETEWGTIRFDEAKVRTEGKLTLKQIEASVSAVVNAILHTGWIDADGVTESPLGKLFKCDAWINQLINERVELEPQLQTGAPTFHQPPEEPTPINQLKELVKQTVRDLDDLAIGSDIPDGRLFEILSEYDLSFDRGVCGWVFRCI